LRYFAILSNTSPGTNKIRVSRDVRFVGEATRNMVQVGQWEDTTMQDRMVMPYHTVMWYHMTIKHKRRKGLSTIRSRCCRRLGTSPSNPSQIRQMMNPVKPAMMPSMTTEQCRSPRSKLNPLYPCFHHQRIRILRSQLSASENRNLHPLIQHHMFRLKTKPHNVKRNLTTHTPSNLPRRKWESCLIQGEIGCTEILPNIRDRLLRNTVYAPVTQLTTYRVIFMLAATEQWEIHGRDRIMAYLLRILDEAIYMVLPQGFVKTRMKRNLMCRLLRSLYGLKQAARVWC